MHRTPTSRTNITPRLPFIREQLLWLMLFIASILLIASYIIGPSSIIPLLRQFHSGVDYHPDTTHSIFLAGQQSVICARNTGIYVGALTVILWSYFSGRGRSEAFPPKRIAVVLAIFFGIMAVDGFNSLAADLGREVPYEPNNLLRVSTGLLAGVTVGSYLLPVLNSLLWKDRSQVSIVGDFYSLGKLLIWPALIFTVIWLEISAAAIPLALMTTLASLILFGAANLIFVVLISRRDNTFIGPGNLLMPGAISIALSVTQMSLLALLVGFLT